MLIASVPCSCLSFTLDLIFELPVFLAFACFAFFLQIFLLISCVIHGTEDTERLVFEGICVSAKT